MRRRRLATAAADLVSGVAAVLENYDSLAPDAFAGGAFAAARSALMSGMRDGIERAMRDGPMHDALCWLAPERASGASGK